MRLIDEVNLYHSFVLVQIVKLRGFEIHVFFVCVNFRFGTLRPTTSVRRPWKATKESFLHLQPMAISCLVAQLTVR